MKVYHQTGANYNWNFESFSKGIGEGIIFSPLNMEATKLTQLSPSVRQSGFLDPQVYLFDNRNEKISSYPYSPSNFTSPFNTTDLSNFGTQLAQFCVDFQVENEFQYVVIPTRYYQTIPTDYFDKMEASFVEPFIDYAIKSSLDKAILLTVIVKQSMVINDESRDNLLNWITKHQGISGVYLIFENEFTTKQIKDFRYIFGALQIIHFLKQNELEVHVGYSNTESFVYSIAMPDSIAMGGYENLRSFKIKRFEKNEEKGHINSPNARVYSSRLLQWIDYSFVDAMRERGVNLDYYFERTEYRDIFFAPEFKWHFTKPPLYKHYFSIFNKQMKLLPVNQSDRMQAVAKSINEAIEAFDSLTSVVIFDPNSDGSHLPHWLNAINSFKTLIT